MKYTLRWLFAKMEQRGAFTRSTARENNALVAQSLEQPEINRQAEGARSSECTTSDAVPTPRTDTLKEAAGTYTEAGLHKAIFNLARQLERELARMAELLAGQLRYNEANPLPVSSTRAQPVAWRYRYLGVEEGPEAWKYVPSESDCNPHNLYERQPLYVAPVSARGATAERLWQCIDKLEAYGTPDHPAGLTFAIHMMPGRFETASEAVEAAMNATDGGTHG